MSGNLRTKIPERQETSNVSSTTGATLCLERVYRPWCREGEHRWSLEDSLDKEIEERLLESRAARVLRTEPREEGAAQRRNMGYLQRVPLRIQ